MRKPLTALVLLLCSPILAHAQEPWLAVNAGGQFGSSDFSHVVDVPLFQTALRADYPVGSGGVFDVGLGMTLPWSLGPVRLELGGSFTVASLDHDATLQAEIRSSLAPGAPLRFEGVEALGRSEKGVHTHFGGTVPVGERIAVSVYGGPSYFAVSQDVISDIDIPGPSARVITQSDALEVHGSSWGFNASADVAFLFTERLGVGLGVRVTGATVSVENLLLKTVTAESVLVASRAGGVQMLGGLRLRFP